MQPKVLTWRRPLIVAAVVAMAATAATQSASAQRPGPAGLLNLPAASANAPAVAAAVVSEVPFSRSIRLKCNSAGSSCFGRAPVPANERWAIQFISCKAETAVDATLRYFYLLVSDASVTKQFGLHYVAPTYRSSYSTVVSQPMVLSVASTNILHVSATSIGVIDNVECAVSGLRQRLG